MKVELFNRYAEDVQERFGLSKRQMFGKTMHQEYVDARQMLYLLCDRNNIRISYIKRYMNKEGKSVHHSTIIHGIKKAKKVMKEDEDYRSVVSSIEDNAV